MGRVSTGNEVSGSGKNRTSRFLVFCTATPALTPTSSLPASELGGWFKFVVTGASARND